MTENQHIRNRMVCLDTGGDESKALQACEALRGINGVLEAYPLNSRRLHLCYSLEFLTFELIEGLLFELGFKLDNSVFSVMRRSIYQYLEDNAREKLHVDEEQHELVCQVDSGLEHDEPEKYWNNYR